MHKLPRVVRHLFCEDGAQAMEERSDSAVFGKADRGEAGAVAKPFESLAKRIFRIQARGRTCTMISMEDITEAEALNFIRGKWHGAKIE